MGHTAVTHTQQTHLFTNKAFIMICKSHKTKNQLFILMLQRRGEETMHVLFFIIFLFLKIRRTAETKSLNTYKQLNSTGKNSRFLEIQAAFLSISLLRSMCKVSMPLTLNLCDEFCMSNAVLFKF